MRYIVTSLLLVLSIAVFAQRDIKKTKLIAVPGMAIGSSVETPEQVLNRAISEAKTEALKRAGVEETIISSADWMKYESEDQFEEMFASNILSDIRGNVVDVEIIDDKRAFVENNALRIKVQINCTVIQYLKEKDKTFDAWIEGIKPYYSFGEALTFSVKSSQNSYLKVFAFTKDETFPVFPTEYETSFQLLRNKVYNFPVNPVMEYALETNKAKDPHRLVFILLKQDIPYTGPVRYKEIANWIFTISPDKRVVKTFNFDLTGKQ